MYSGTGISDRTFFNHVNVRSLIPVPSMYDSRDKHLRVSAIDMSQMILSYLTTRYIRHPNPNIVSCQDPGVWFGF